MKRPKCQYDNHQDRLSHEILDTTAIPIFLLDDRKNFLLVNKAFAELAGRKVVECEGCNLSDIKLPDSMQKMVENAVDKAFHDSANQTVEIETKNRWFQIRVEPKDENNKISRVMVFCNDITERRQAEEALRRSEQRYRNLFESIDEGFCIIEVLFDSDVKPVDLRFLETNPAFINQTGLQDAVGKRMRELEPNHEEHWYEIYGRIALTGRPERFTHEAKYLDDRWFDVYAFRVGQPKEHKVAILFKDIGEQKRAEAALRRLNKTLEQQVAERTAEADKRAEDLQKLALELSNAEDKERRHIAMILHDDLQQCLAAIRFRLGSLVSDSQLNPKTAESMSALDSLIKESIQKCRDLSHELSPPVLHQNGLIAALQWLSQDMGENHGMQVDLHAQSDAEPASSRLAFTLFRSIRELLFNIIKHADTDRAEIQVNSQDGWFRIRVSDPGKGFNLDQIRIGQDESGFGLFNVEERIHFLGGTFHIQSAPGEGTGIDIMVPNKLEQPENRDELMPEMAEKSGDEYGQPAPEHDGKIRILLAEDHAVMREGLAGMLQNHPDLEVVAQAQNGVEAVQMTDQSEPDVILMDIAMPQMDGIVATEQILKKHPYLHIIGLSMHDDPSVEKSMKRAGASAYIYKAAPSDELLRIIRMSVDR